MQRFKLNVTFEKRTEKTTRANGVETNVRTNIYTKKAYLKNDGVEI